jgi:hypothetical protein
MKHEGGRPGRFDGLEAGLLVNLHAATIKDGLRRLSRNKSLPAFL